MIFHICKAAWSDQESNKFGPSELLDNKKISVVEKDQ